MADAWIASEEGDDLRAQKASPEYIRARGVDEALAHMADRVNASTAGYTDNSMSAKLLRTYMRVLARIADWFGDARKAEGYRGVTNDKARQHIKETFGRLRAGEAANPEGGHGIGPAYRRETQRATNLHPTVAPKRGLLDTPMRLAFQKTGALAVWRGTIRLLEKTAGAALNNRVGEVIKAGLIDRYGLSHAALSYATRRRVGLVVSPRATASR
jgi:hypothetical protein